MDALFFLKSNTLRLPYPQLVQDMREIINIGFAHRDFVKVGRANAVASKRFLPPYPPTIDPPHVLTLLAEKLDVESISQASQENLNRSGRLKTERWEEQVELPEELDLEEVAKEMVLGVQAEAEVSDDGTVQVISGSEIVPAGDGLATDKVRKAERKVKKASEKRESRFEERGRFRKERTQSGISQRKMRRDPLESRTQATEDRPVRADTPLPNHANLEARVSVHDASLHPEYSTVQQRGMANDQPSHSKARMYNDENDLDKVGGFKARVMRETEMDEPVSQVRSTEEYAYESTSFDWLLDPAPPQRQLARSPSRSGEAPKFQWTPLEREQVEVDEGVVGQEDVESLEEELEGLYPGQGEEDDWGLNDDDHDPGKEDGESRR
jgi:hypothetical protein